MTTAYQQLKAAWESADRRGELNRAAERLAQVVTGNEIDEALGQLLEEVRVAGANDQTEEIINDVGDRLHGWCHESNHIKAKWGTVQTDGSGTTRNGSHPGETIPAPTTGGV